LDGSSGVKEAGIGVPGSASTAGVGVGETAGEGVRVGAAVDVGVFVGKGGKVAVAGREVCAGVSKGADGETWTASAPA
jgi:hypothetical protein